MKFCLGETYLLLAEARIQQGNTAGGPKQSMRSADVPALPKMTPLRLL